MQTCIFLLTRVSIDRHSTAQTEIHEHQQRDGSKEYPLPVPWINSKEHQLEFFAIPAEFSLNRASSFQSGRVYGMDVTSGAAVAALLFDLFDSARPDSRKDEQSNNSEVTPLRILDLCCAPGYVFVSVLPIFCCFKVGYHLTYLLSYMNIHFCCHLCQP